MALSRPRVPPRAKGLKRLPGAPPAYRHRTTAGYSPKPLSSSSSSPSSSSPLPPSSSSAGAATVYMASPSGQLCSDSGNPFGSFAPPRQLCPAAW